MKVVLLSFCIALAAGVRMEFNLETSNPAAEWIKDAEGLISGTGHNETSAKIIGGKVADVKAHPYLAGLIIQFTDKKQLCGASLVSPDRLLTAAHCCYSSHRLFFSRIVVVLGSQYLLRGGLSMIATRAVVHPKYINEDSLAYDIAVIYLPQKVKLSATINTISIPKPHQLPSSEYMLKWTNAVGYGVTSSGYTDPVNFFPQRLHVWLKVIPQGVCRYTYGKYGNYICTSGWGGVGICRGDSGGPLVFRKNRRPYLIGIASFSAERCKPGRPSGFVKISFVYNFIKDHVKF